MTRYEWFSTDGNMGAYVLIDTGKQGFDLDLVRGMCTSLRWAKSPEKNASRGKTALSELLKGPLPAE